MGWYGDGIGHGSRQRHRFGHGNRRGCWDKLNGDDHDDEGWVYRWLGTSHGDLNGGHCVDSNVWGHITNG